MWYKRKQTDRVFARQLQSNESIHIDTRSGLDYDGEKYARYGEGDYIVYEEGKGIYFLKGKDFVREFE